MGMIKLDGYVAFAASQKFIFRQIQQVGIALNIRDEIPFFPTQAARLFNQASGKFPLNLYRD